jgi:hypothetical protein
MATTMLDQRPTTNDEQRSRRTETTGVVFILGCGVPVMNVYLAYGDGVLFDPIDDHDEGTGQDAAAEKDALVRSDR